MGREEVVAVLGHELGHWAHGHTMANLVITELNLLFMLSVFAYFYKWVFIEDSIWHLSRSIEENIEMK